MDKQLIRLAFLLLAIMPTCAAQIASPIVVPQKPTIISSNLLTHWNMVQGANAQEVYNVAAPHIPFTNYLVSSDDFSVWSPQGSATGALNSITFAASAASRVYSSFPNAAYGGTTPYTLTCEASVASGTATFQLGVGNATPVFTYSTDQTATTTWQTFSFTATVAAGTSATGAGAAIQNGSAGTAATINFRNCRLNAGSSDLGAEYQPDYHAWLGTGSSVEASFDPSWTSEGMNLLPGTGTSSTLLAKLRGNFSYLTATFYIALKLTGTAGTTGFMPLLGAQTTSKLYAQYSSTQTMPTLYMCNPNPAPGAYAADGNWHVLAFTWNGVAGAIYLDGAKLNQGTWCGSSLPIASTASWYIGNQYTSTNGFPGVIADFLIYNINHSDQQVYDNTRAIWAELASRGIKPPAFNKFLVIDGDSISVPYLLTAAQSYFYIAAQTTSPILPFRTVALSGATCPNRTSAIPTSIQPLSVLGTKRALVIYCGTNDIGLSNATITAAQVYSNMQAYVTAARAAGYTKIAIATLLPFAEGTAGCAGNNPVRDSVNTMLRSSPAGADVLIDWAADATIGPDAVCGNTTYYSDGTHPTALTDSIMATYLEAQLPNLLP